MSVFDRAPWIRDHIALYATDPVAAHMYQAPGQDAPKPSLLLTTTGRKSGEQRSIPLIYGKDGANHVIVASLGGSPTHPSWYLNLDADPRAHIQVAADHHDVRARVAEGEERARLFEMMARILPQYHQYAAATEGIREIPVVVLEPA